MKRFDPGSKGSWRIAPDDSPARRDGWRTLRFVLLKHARADGAAYLSTALSMWAEAIPEAVSDRWGVEGQFHDVKELWGVGEQPVRNVRPDIGGWNYCGWLYTLVALTNVDRPAEQLVDRADRPGDDPERRPSHVDRRRKITRSKITRRMSRNEFPTCTPTSIWPKYKSDSLAFWALAV